MKTIYLEPSSIIWDEDDFRENAHKYDEIIDDLYSLLSLESEGGLKFLILEDLIEQLSETFPVNTIQSSHRSHTSDFITLVYTSMARWQTTAVKVDDTNYDQLFDNVELTPNLLSFATTKNLVDLKNMSSSYIYNNIDNPIASFNIFRIRDITATLKQPDQADISDVKRAYINFLECENYAFSDQLICEFSPKHRPNSGWGTLMPHEELDLMQNLLDTSIPAPHNPDRLRYNYCHRDQVSYAFRITNGAIFHPYPVNRDEIPNQVLQELNI